MIDLEELKRAIKGGYHITLRESQELITEVERLEAERLRVTEAFALYVEDIELNGG